MAEIIKDFWVGMPWYMYLLLVLAFGLLVASFIVPPLGAIHPTVLQGTAMILGFTWLFYTTCNIPTFIERGAKIKAKWKDAEIEIGRHKKQNEALRTEDEYPEEEKEEE
jgi:hypothetical protein